MDGGYSWVIFGAAFVVYGIVFGMLTSFGVYFVVFLEHFQCSRQDVALVGGLSMSAVALAGPPADFMLRKYGPQITVIIGGVISCIGYILNFSAASIQHLAVTYAVAGFGMGMTSVPAISMQPVYFDKYRNLVIALVPVAVPIGLFIFPPLFYQLIKTFSWQGSMLINSGITLQLAVCGALLKPKKVQKTSEKMTTSEKSNFCQALAKSCQVFSDSKMVVFCLSAVCWCGCTSIYFPFINDLAVKNTGLPVGETTSILLVCGLCDLVARIFASISAHFPQYFNRVVLYTLSNVTFGLAAIFSTVCTNRIEFFVSAGFFGAGFGYMISTYGIVAGELLGVDKISTVIGYGNLSAGIGAVVMPFFGGLLADLYGQEFAFYLSGSSALSAGVCYLVIILITYQRKKKRQRRDESADKMVEMKEMD